MNVRSWASLICLIGIVRIPLFSQDSTAQRLLSLSLEELMSIKVASATRYETDLKHVPAFAIVITRQQILERGYATLLDLLHDVPGFDIIHVNGLYPQLVHQRGLRGNNNRTLIFIDGILVQNLYEMNILGAPLDYSLANVQQVEILYGPTSALYGSNAITGIINIRTFDGQDYQNRPIFESRVRVYGNVNRTGVDASVGIGNHMVPSNLKWSINATFRQGDGLDFRNVRKIISSQPLRGTAFSSKYAASWMQAFQLMANLAWENLSFEYFYHIYRMGEGTFNNGFWYLDHQVNTLRYRWNNSVQETFLPNSQWAPYGQGIRLRYRQKHSERLLSDISFIARETGLAPESFDADIGPRWKKNLQRDREIVPGDSIYAFFYRRHSYSYSLNYQIEFLPHPAHKVITGISGEKINTPLDYEIRRFLPATGNFSEWQLQPRILFNNYAFYFQDEFTLNNWKIFAGFRLDYFAYNPDAPTESNRQYYAFNPRVSLIYTPSAQWHVKIIGGSAFRTPTPWELFSTTNFRIANPALSPENNVNIDLVTEWHPSPHFDITLDINYQYLQNVIFNSVAIGNGVTQNQNLGAISQHGAILMLNWLLHPRVKIHANYTFQYSIFKNLPQAILIRSAAHNNNQVPDLPQHKGNVMISWKPLPNTLVVYRGNLVGERHTIGTNPVVTVPGYWLSTFTFQWQRAFQSNSTVEFTIWNAFNQQAWDPGLRSGDGFRFPTMHPVGHRTFWFRIYVEMD